MVEGSGTTHWGDVAPTKPTPRTPVRWFPLRSGTITSEGFAGSTADWQGKVILVNFWATWCNPCRQEMPRIEKAYAQYHAKGLEVLGITSDTDRKALLDYLAQNPQMPWPELFDAHNHGFHPLAEKYGIEAIPVLFLIDRRGILRTTEARADFEEMIPKLLEEKETSN